MNHLTKSKLVLYLSVIFVAGGITGVAIGWGEARNQWTGPPDTKKICDHFRNLLHTELGLSSAQVAQLDPLLQKRAKGMAAIHSRTIKEIEDLIRASNEEIATVLQLTPEQRDKFEALEKRRRAHFERRDRSGSWAKEKEKSAPPE